MKLIYLKILAAVIDSYSAVGGLVSQIWVHIVMWSLLDM